LIGKGLVRTAAGSADSADSVVGNRDEQPSGSPLETPAAADANFGGGE
jgi:hypothetical protein